jgi:nicotinate phosphoribosyltransferase
MCEQEEVMKDFDIATSEDIFSGKVTDVYFLRTKEVLEKAGIDKSVVMEIAQKGMPDEYPFGIFTGLEHVLRLLEGKNVDVYAIPEGSVFFEDIPVLTIVGKYLEFGIYETAILGFICQASGITTKALKCKLAAGNKTLLSFGARRAHPAISGMIDKYAYIGGCDGFSVIFTEELVDIPASGTVPHTLILLVGDTAKAMELFDKYIDPSIKRLALIDTFNDERFETIKVAEVLKNRLDSVRLDTPSSRRGNLRKIAEEIRWELDTRGFAHVKLFASGGLDEKNIIELRDIIDGFGVGTSISNAKVMDFSMDIVSIEGMSISKKGKKSFFKYAFQCESCLYMSVSVDKDSVLMCPKCKKQMKNVTVQYMKKGKLIKDKDSVSTIRNRVLSQKNKLYNYIKN